MHLYVFETDYLQMAEKGPKSFRGFRETGPWPQPSDKIAKIVKYAKLIWLCQTWLKPG